MQRLDVTGLPDLPSGAAACFHSEWLGQAQAAEGDLTVIFAPADHAHAAWRLAAIQSLARENAPRRVNAIASSDPQAIAAALDYLITAEGLTGQYLPLDSAGSGPVIPSPL